MKRVTGVRPQGFQEQRVTKLAQTLYAQGHGLREAVARARKSLYHPRRSKSASTKYGGPARTISLRCAFTGVVAPMADLARSTSTHLDKHGKLLSKASVYVLAVF